MTILFPLHRYPETAKIGVNLFYHPYMFEEEDLEHVTGLKPKVFWRLVMILNDFD